jgi:hypothetical protein
MGRIFLATFAAAAIFGVVSAMDDTHTIDLGGLRKAKAVLTVTPTEYVVKIRFLPVHCFDAATNAKINQEKARGLALQGLAKHLSTKESVEFSISGVQIGNSGLDGKFYTLGLRVPRKGVLVVEERKKIPMKEGEDRLILKSDLFTRKRDYQNTLEQLASSILADIHAAVEMGVKEETPREEFQLIISAIQKRSGKNLENLGREVNNDLLLLSDEQEELNEKLNQVKAKILKTATESINKYQEKERPQ